MNGMLIFVIILVFFAILVGLSSIRIIRQSSVAMVERLGKFHKKLDAGFHFVVPFIDRVTKTVDLKTQVLDSVPQPVITKDNVGIDIDTVTYYKITDAFKAVYEIENLKYAISNITATTLRDVIGGLELDDTYTSREQINHRLRKELDDATGAWGVKVERVEVKNINPPHEVSNAMEKQMRAEREKRAQILEAQGKKESAILSAQGDRESQILRAEAEKEAQILRADAEKETKIRMAEGEAQAIERIAEAEKLRIEKTYKALKEANLDEKILALQSIQAMEKVAQGENNMIVPYDAVKLMGTVGSLKDIVKQ